MSESAILVSAHPVIPVRDMDAALVYYTVKLGFTIVFNDANEPGETINYAGVRRDDICLHLQTMAPDENPTMPLIRMCVKNIETLYEEYSTKGVIAPTGQLEPKPWGSKDFGVYDLNNTALVFYEDL